MDPELTLSLKNFRAFARTDPIRIRPITILLGENSTGKTSFLAALRFALGLSDREKRGYFNVYPFDLGSFDDIAYDSPGRGISKTFSISLEKTFDLREETTLYFSSKSEHHVIRAKLDVDFSSRFGDVSICSFKFAFSNLSAEYCRDAEEPFTFHRGRAKIGTSEAVKKRDKSRTDLKNSDLRRLSYAMFEELLDFHNPAAHKAFINERRLIAQAFEGFINPAYTIHSSPPVRSIPKRVYTSSDDTSASEVSNAPYELNRLKRSDQRRWSKLNAGLNRYGKLSGLFTRFDVTKLTPMDAGPFQLKVKVRGRSSTIADVGYGVSQSLPIMTDLIEAVDGRHAFLFQQPEVHLHPKAQAALGSIFADYVASHPSSLIIAETHSDYLIDRLRIAVRENVLDPTMVGILYFDASKANVAISQIDIDQDGNILNAPKAYREFFIREQERVLGF